MSNQSGGRDAWGSRIGLILAMSGSAIGLGNFLRFPVQAAQNGGGAFMIPYFVALLFLGIPLMWVEWTIGRYGGQYGYGSAVGAFGAMASTPKGARRANLLGLLGIVVPILFAVYYTYVESWTMAYSFFSITNQYNGLTSMTDMSAFLGAYQGKVSNSFFSGQGSAIVFFLITLACNVYVLSRGISGGIEKLAKIAMPLLFLFAFVLVWRVWTLDTPDPAKPENTVFNGFAFLWNPDFSAMGSAKAWLAAAGQIFFTLSIGSASILTYASYLKRREDVVLTGLTTTMTNEFAEVILGASIAIPVAVAFFGVTETQMIAKGGSYDLGFVAMPVIFQQLPLGSFFGMLWFGLLFFAGITSSVALCSPAMAFLQDQLHVSRGKASLLVGAVMLVWGLPIVLFLPHGYLDEYDFWAGTFLLVVVALIEAILLGWVFGMDRAWKEMHEGAQIRIPLVFKYIIKYIAPIYLIGLLVFWGYQDGLPVLTMANRDPVDVPYLWLARGSMALLGGIVLALIFRAYKKGTLRDDH